MWKVYEQSMNHASLQMESLDVVQSSCEIKPMQSCII